MNIPKQRVDLYFITRKKAFKQPIIIEFFKRETNRELLERIIKEPTLDNTQRLDSEFRLFYKKAKITKYISSLIYFYSIDFDKKLRKNRERNLLIIDYLPEKGNSDNNIPISIGSLKEQIENSALYLALDELSNKQVKILELFYVYNFTNKEIADYFHDSPQNTSNLHKKALKKLKSALLSRKDTIC